MHHNRTQHMLLNDDLEGVYSDPLTIKSDLEGASVRVLKIDEVTWTVSFMPGGDLVRGWPCWWYFRVDGIAPSETITLRLRGSVVTVKKQKPLSDSWTMPAQATFSIDGETWLHTENGRREKEWMIYRLKPDAASVFVAWGPLYTPKTAAKFVREMSKKSPHVTATELCRSREDRPVQILHVREGERARKQRFGVWIHARQHA